MSKKTPNKIEKAVSKLSLQKGDILIFDPACIEIRQLMKISLPPEVGAGVFCLPIFRRPQDPSIAECVQRMSLADLKEVLAKAERMAAKVETPLLITAPGASSLPSAPTKSLLIP